MSIVSSERIVQGLATEMRYVTERHTDHTGATWPIYYWAAPGLDLDVILSANAARLEVMLSDAEIEALLGE